MTLKVLERKWRGYLRSASCPPVLGLAPLSEAESDQISQLVVAKLKDNQQLPRLFHLLDCYPACLAVWLARKAGEAYDGGAFWDKFGALIGTPIPLGQRIPFVQKFRFSCGLVMACWLPPTELGGKNNVAEFLYQAGLPLDRCDGFAQHVRKVERAQGLPDLDAPDAGEQLSEAVLESLQSIPVPSLKRALRGPAGARICEVALRVIFTGDFGGINPRLGRELERVFDKAAPLISRTCAWGKIMARWSWSARARMQVSAARVALPGWSMGGASRRRAARSSSVPSPTKRASSSS